MSMIFPFRDARYMTVAVSSPGGDPPVTPRSGGPAPLTPPGGPSGGPGRRGGQRRRAIEARRRLLRVELDDELFLDLGVDLRPDGQRVHQDPHLVRHDLEPGRHGALADLGPGDDERRHLERLGGHLDDVVLADPVGRDVDLPAVHREVAVRYQLAGHVAALGEARAEDDVVQAALKQLEHGLAGPAVLAGRLHVVAVELPLQDAVDPAGLLLLPDLRQVVAFLGPVPAMLARRVRPDLDRALRRVALGALQEELGLLPAAQLAVRAGVSSHLSLSPWVGSGGKHGPQTRRRFGGRQPLCGTGVMSWIEPTSSPVACSDLMAVSRPEPGPLTKTSTLRMPCSIARRAAASAAIWAAYGVDLRDPLNPTWPADAHEMTFPVGSVIEMIVLLNVLLMWACP